MFRQSVKSNTDLTPVALYDMALPLPERQEQRLEFGCGREAAQHLGVPPYRVYHNLRSGLRIWSPIHNRWFAVRYQKQANDRS